jgi:hypothetical protein
MIKDEQTQNGEQDKIIVVEKNAIKTLVYSFITCKVKLLKTIKTINPICHSFLFKNYNLLILIDDRGFLQCLNLFGGILYEHKPNDINGKFTKIYIQGTLIYAGTEKGTVVVFESLSGEFIKQMPF